jgi:hypothetical protein
VEERQIKYSIDSWGLLGSPLKFGGVSKILFGHCHCHRTSGMHAFMHSCIHVFMYSLFIHVLLGTYWMFRKTCRKTLRACACERAPCPGEQSTETNHSRVCGSIRTSLKQLFDWSNSVKHRKRDHIHSLLPTSHEVLDVYGDNYRTLSTGGK